VIAVGKKRYLLTHDLGTTADKACIFDDKLNLIASEVMDYRTYYPKNGKAVQRPEDWWSVFCTTTQSILRKCAIDPSEIAAVSCSGHSPSMVPISANGELILEAVPIYADLSSREEVSKFMESISEEDFYSMTGAGQVPEQYSLFKMMAFRRENQEGFNRTWKILNTVDYLVYRLTGNVRTDFSQACNTGALDIIKREWSEEILEAAEVPSEMMPEPVDSTSVVGEVTDIASSQSGLCKGTSVVMGGGDVACAAAGAGAVTEGVSYVCLGSAAWMGFFSKQPVLDYESKLVNYCHIVPGGYALQYQMTGAGICYQWLRDTIYRYKELDDDSTEETDYFEMMNAEANKSGVGANRLIFLPYMRGIWAGKTNPDARGVLFGLNLGNTVGDIYRSALEGMVFGIKEIMDSFEKLGYSSRQVTVIGGCAKSKLWRQVIADITGREVLCPAVIREAGSLGASIAAAIGVGMIDSFDDTKKIIEIVDVSYPNEKNHTKYQKYYSVFLETKERLNDLFEKLANIE